MGTLAGAKFWVNLALNGVHPRSVVRMRAGHADDIRFKGTVVGGPDRDLLRRLAIQVLGGEYDAPFFTAEPGQKVIDVGANVGLFSLLAAARGAVVEAYEPHPETYDWLVRNTRGRDVTCTQAAVVGSLSEGQVELWLHPGRNSRHTTARYEVGSGEPLLHKVEVPAIRLEEVIGHGCDLLKLDCEGAEFEIVDGTPIESLARAARLVCEVHSNAGDPAKLKARLREAGFELWVDDLNGAALSLLYAKRHGIDPGGPGESGRGRGRASRDRG